MDSEKKLSEKCKDFTHLVVQSHYSLLDSTMTIKKIVQKAKDFNMKSVALTDHLSMSGAFEFSNECIKNGLKPILGIKIDFYIDKKELDGYHECKNLVLLCKNEKGYRNLLKIHNEVQKKEKKVIDLSVITENLNGIVLICGGYETFCKQMVIDSPEKKDVCEKILLDLYKNSQKGDFFLGLTRHGRESEEKLMEFMVDFGTKLGMPFVAVNDVRFENKDHFLAYDAIHCIKTGEIVIKRGRSTLNNSYYFKSEEEMVDLFSDIPEAITNSVLISQKCSFFLEQRECRFPKYIQDDNLSEEELLLKFVEEGMQKKEKEGLISEGKINIYRERVKSELEIINKMKFSGYFLVVYDFVNWAKKNDIPVGPGRGSCVGCIVSWFLGITDADPIKYGLLFERFLNPERISMPDMDIDFCQSRRDEVINYVINRYGKDKVGHIATYGTLQPKAALKDIGRSLGIPYNRVDTICKMIPWNPLEPITLERAIEIDKSLYDEYMRDPDITQLMDVSMVVEGIIRHRSVHAAGVIISHESLGERVPLELDENGKTIVSVNMSSAEMMGFIKFDFLGLKNLTCIKHAVDLVKENFGKSLNLSQIDTRDPKTFQLLQSAKTKGIFQLEAQTPSDAMRQMKVDSLEQIVAITSLNRPGPMSNIPSFIKRKLGEEKIEYLHPSLEEILKETYGIIVYQEQVMSIAREVAGYSLGQADILRRAMGKKKKEEMEKQKDNFIKGAEKKNISKKLAEEIFFYIEKFAGYGFNKSHALAYSIISLQTAFLKSHYPTEFFVSILNLDSGDTNEICEIISDARNFDIKILLPDINISQSRFVGQNKSITYSLSAIKSVGEKFANLVEEDRKNNGKYGDIFDFASRLSQLTTVNKRTLEFLIKVGCFDNLHKSRNQLIASIEKILKSVSAKQKSLAIGQDSLFGDSDMSMINSLSDDFVQETEDEKLKMELECIGFYASMHPLEKHKNLLLQNKVITYQQFFSLKDEKYFWTAGVINTVTHRFTKRGRFAFVSVVDVNGVGEYAIFDSDLIDKKRSLLEHGQLILAKIERQISDLGSSRVTIKDIFDFNELISGSIFNIEKDSDVRKNEKVKLKNKTELATQTSAQEENAKHDMNSGKNEEVKVNIHENIEPKAKNTNSKIFYKDISKINVFAFGVIGSHIVIKVTKSINEPARNLLKSLRDPNGSIDLYLINTDGVKKHLGKCSEKTFETLKSIN